MISIFVGNLSFQTTQDELLATFSQYGPVERVNIITDRDTGQARGFAFVEMSDVEGAQRAIADINQHELGGRSLTVNEAKPPAARSTGGGFGGGRQRRDPRW